jgi:hypothetical protein
MPEVRFEPAAASLERTKTFRTLDRSANVISGILFSCGNFESSLRVVDIQFLWPFKHWASSKQYCNVNGHSVAKQRLGKRTSTIERHVFYGVLAATVDMQWFGKQVSTIEALFSVGCVQRRYSSFLSSEFSVQGRHRKFVEDLKCDQNTSFICNGWSVWSSETVLVFVLRSVARRRLVKTATACATVNWKVCESAIDLH